MAVFGEGLDTFRRIFGHGRDVTDWKSPILFVLRRLQQLVGFWVWVCNEMWAWMMVEYLRMTRMIDFIRVDLKNRSDLLKSVPPIL